MEIRFYRKRPVTIQAVQRRRGENDDLIKNWIEDNGGQWTASPDNLGELGIHTLEGTMWISDKDFVIRGVQGEFYPCKPDIFWQTYEEVEPWAE